MLNLACQPSDAIVYPSALRNNNTIVWQTRYEGLVSVAYVGGKAIAGISGPWSDRFALTWWGLPPASTELELFDSLQAAQREVTARIQRMYCGRVVTQTISPLRPASRSSWFDHIRTLLRHRGRDQQLASSARDTVENLRLRQLRQDMDISGLHFGAFE